MSDQKRAAGCPPAGGGYPLVAAVESAERFRASEIPAGTLDQSRSLT